MTDNISGNVASLPATRPPEPDVHGQAALLLVECLLHGLVEHSVISAEDAIAIVDSAAEVKAEIAEDLGESPETADRSLSILTAMGDSLRLDVQP